MNVEARNVVLAAEGEIGRIQFVNTRNFNGLTLEDARELLHALESLSSRPELKVIVLSGGRDYFCTGGAMDLLDQLAAATLQERREMLRTVQDVVRAIRTVPALVYAQFEGLAAGAGVDLLLACDQIIASESARINFSFGKLQLIPDLGGLFLLAQHVGQSRALSIYCKSETLDVRAMERWGLLSESPLSSFEGYEWRRALRGALAISKDALVAAKASLWALAAPQFERHLELVTESVIHLLDGEQHRNAVRRTRGLQKAVGAAAGKPAASS